MKGDWKRISPELESVKQEYSEDGVEKKISCYRRIDFRGNEYR